jgi:3-deoxy-7-phosphoheptulonate synthase
MPPASSPFLEANEMLVLKKRQGAKKSSGRSLEARLETLGLRPHPVGANLIILEAKGSSTILEAINASDAIEHVQEIATSSALASRAFHPQDTIVEIGQGVRVGGGYLAVVAGPCSIESESRLTEVAQHVRAAGANILRGGAFKPRTCPYSFQGLGEDGLKILQSVGERFSMPTVTEVMDPRQVELVERYADIFQIGARNMQNFDLLKEVGKTRLPVLIKRGMSATVKDLLMSAEYVLAQGNDKVILCERGVRSFEDSTRNMLDLAAVPNVQGQSHLPIIVDPSHATGRPDLIPAMAVAAIAARADGIHIEVHQDPGTALSDGPQALLPDQFSELMQEVALLADVLDRTIDYCPGLLI